MALNFDSTARTYRKGTVQALTGINLIEVGATMSCIRDVPPAKKGNDYTVTGVSAICVNITNGRTKLKVPTDRFIESFERRRGPVFPDKIYRGLQVRITATTGKCRTGDVVTLTETGGSVFDCRTESGQKCCITKQELSLCCSYL